MSITLYPYQRESIDAVYHYFEHNDGNPVVAMPTGTGKSVVIAAFIKEVFQLYPNQRIMMLTHVKELIEQNYKELLKAWPTAPCGIYSAGLGRRDAHYPITFAGIASVYRRPEDFGTVDLILIDECHLVGTKSNGMYLSFTEALRQVNPALKIIGYSATPYRLGLGVITDGGLFTDFCFDNTRRDDFIRLIEEGYLAPLVPKQTKTQIDLTGVQIKGGEFVADQLQRAANIRSVMEKAVEEILVYGAERKHWLIFATGIQHVEDVTECLNARGINAVSVHSQMDNDTRDEAIAGFKSGKYRALVNMNVMTTGFNFPELDLIGMLRPTASPGLWVQMLGRGTRPAPGKQNCLVLDFAGNTRRIGPINDPAMPKRGSSGNGSSESVAPTKVCPACSSIVFAGCKTCPDCGANLVEEKQPHDAKADTLELIAPKVSQVVFDFKVTRIVYRKHVKEGKPPSLRIDYFSGLRRFSEWICFEHHGYPRLKALKWWQLRSQYPMPRSVDEAIDAMPYILKPSSIRVWFRSVDYPEIITYDFSNVPGSDSGQARPNEAASRARDHQ